MLLFNYLHIYLLQIFFTISQTWNRYIFSHSSFSFDKNETLLLKCQKQKNKFHQATIMIFNFQSTYHYIFTVIITYAWTFVSYFSSLIFVMKATKNSIFFCIQKKSKWIEFQSYYKFLIVTNYKMFVVL